MWTLDGLDLEQDFGMGFLKNQTHKLLVSNKISFDVNSEFEESNFENFGRIYPYGVSYSKKESVNGEAESRKWRQNLKLNKK